MGPLDNLKVYALGLDIAVAGCNLADALFSLRRYGMADQICRAAMSIPANIAEGYALGTRPQLIRFLRTSFGSNEELRTHVEVVRRSQVGVEIPPILLTAPQEEGAMLVGLLKRYGARV